MKFIIFLLGTALAQYWGSYWTSYLNSTRGNFTYPMNWLNYDDKLRRTYFSRLHVVSGDEPEDFSFYHSALKSRNLALLTNSSSDVEELLKHTLAKVAIVIFDEGDEPKTDVMSVQMYGIERNYADEIWDKCYNTTGIISSVVSHKYRD